jgi:Periplasmic binding protein domain
VNDFPALPSGPGNAIWNAYQDLVSRLSNSKSCSGAAQLNVFDKLNKDPAFRGDTNHTPINTANFLIYLSNTPHFVDGTQSTWDSKNALCGSGRPWWSFQSLKCSAPIGYPPTIKASFQDDPTQSAATETPSYPLTVFFRPSGTYAIQQANNGKNAFNEAMFFHEALHGITGQGDKNLQAVFGYQTSDPSSVITKAAPTAIVASNDAIAGGAIQALEDKGWSGRVLVSGQDADLAAIERIFDGSQLMTVYKPVGKEARTAAEAAMKLARTKTWRAAAEVPNGTLTTKAILLTPICVTQENAKQTVLKDGFQKLEIVRQGLPIDKQAQLDKP